MAKNYKLSKEADRMSHDNETANPNWFRPDVDPMAIRKLMQKSDAIALRDTFVWLGAMCLSAGIAIALWPSWWSAGLPDSAGRCGFLCLRQYLEFL